MIVLLLLILLKLAKWESTEAHSWHKLLTVIWQPQEKKDTAYWLGVLIPILQRLNLQKYHKTTATIQLVFMIGCE